MHLLSTRDLATALGVSESSIKRWADDGTLRASRTAGGHRRIPRAEAIRFVRETGLGVVRPELLGLDELGVAAADASGAADDTERLHDYLVRGAGGHARGLVLQLYLAGQPVAAILDGPVRSALARIGERWLHDADGVFCEHRATELCIQAIQQLRLLVAVAEGAPVALGGAPGSDPYLLPTLGAATVLAGEGLDAVNLGADTPLAALERAAAALAPRLLWLSVTTPPPAELGREVARLARHLAPRGVQLVVGGQSARTLALPALPNLHVHAAMAELAAFARGLVRATPPAG